MIICKIYENGIEIHLKWHPELDHFVEDSYILIKRGSRCERLAHKAIFDGCNIEVTV